MAILLFHIFLIFANTGTLFAENNCSIAKLLKYLDIIDNKTLLWARPVKNWDEPLVVGISMTVDNIVELDGKSQSMLSMVWFDMVWQNSFISWNPEDFCGISDIFIPLDTVWMPEVYVYENINEDVSVKINFLNVNNDGMISQSKPWRIVSTCMLNVRKFPFDTQKCSITFGPYVHSIEEVVMISIFSANELKEMTLAHYINRGEWELLDIEVLDQNLTFGKNLFSKVKYTITLQRTSALYIINLIAPAIFLLIVDFGSMFIPITAGERLGVKVTIVLGFSVLLLILNDLVPSTNSTPILGVFFTLCLLIMILSILGTIAVLHMVEQSTDRKIPSWLQTCLFKYLAKFLSVNTNCLSQKKTGQCSNDLTDVSRTQNEVKEEWKTEQESHEVRLLKMLHLQIPAIKNHLEKSSEEESNKAQWLMAALVIDRLLCILYMLTVVISMTAVAAIWASN
ncbi:5-hydroxytryptamine receptor 3A-like [Erpetoichthys calabaricus]|uniref:5-hydroxytryptamine receptor 3A-like n=1 Tax=Erpetoichthys calabaricus TaxID=27687 RepID=UPI002234DFF8|nr:5-hydroxytryptamine receptor 3A-like [Erpetoichthys calabaricus]